MGKNKRKQQQDESKKASELTERRRHRTGKSKQYGTGTSRGTRTGPKLRASNEESDGKERISSSE